ncbi:START domain-containing protein [Mucilaginibacter sp. dw_454]|uniref:START domain-containing protein n=1 Tax=Mucilaginibacter sp. dw_454 TaxID=2720079 RepID=UPI001BD54466|nr:START domain-containing protein [Mucilaginibacter sp. dw_454]
MKLKLLFVFTLILTTRLAFAQEWSFKTESSGIKVYVDNKSGMKVKPIKVECTFDAMPVQLAAVLMDIKNYPDWVYKMKSATIIKQTSPTDLSYYAEIDMPWPTTDRDFAAHIYAVEDPATKVITVNAPSVADLVPEKKELVRVKKSNGKWVLTPDGKDKTKVTYYLTLEPDGGAPAWIINLFVSSGPMQSFKMLKSQVEKAAYKNAVLQFR